MAQTSRICVQCRAPDDLVVYRRRRDGAWFDAGRRAWCDHHGTAQDADPRRVVDNPEWLESVGRARQQRTRVRLDGVCSVCAAMAARFKQRLDGAA